jgi:hypothetical protein
MKLVAGQERLLTERMKTAKLKEEDSDDEIVFSDEDEVCDPPSIELPK